MTQPRKVRRAERDPMSKNRVYLRRAFAAAAVLALACGCREPEGPKQVAPTRAESQAERNEAGTPPTGPLQKIPMH
jgi:hypothetical protein